MTITAKRVHFDRRTWGAIGLLAITILEASLSMFLVVSLAANVLFPQGAGAAAGVSAKLSYQGRLTDTSGNPLGGSSGTNYCMQFSIFDAATAGTKLWPAGTPAGTQVKVKDGIFATDLGTADSLSSFDFSANNNVYLQVAVYNTAPQSNCASPTGGAYETLDVRQRIDAVGFARAAEGVYSSLLRAPTGGTVVQIGTGTGATTPIFLGLDVKNTDEAVGASCTTSGQIWYNSTDSRARVCQGGVIQDMVDGMLVRLAGSDVGRASVAFDFTGGGVSVSRGAGGVININVPFAGIAAGASTLSSGSLVFSNANGVSFGFNGSTLTASVAAGGGGGATLSYYENMPINFAASSVVGLTGSNEYISPFVLDQAVSASYIRMPASFNMVSTSLGTTGTASTTFSQANTQFAVIYSQGAGANSLSLQSIASGSAGWTWQVSVTATGAGSVWSLTNRITYPTRGGTSSISSTASASSTIISVATTGLTALTGWRYLDIPFATSLAPNNYWMAIIRSSATGGGKAIDMALSHIMLSQATTPIGNLGAATNNSLQLQMGLGSYSTNAMTTASIGLASISSVASQPRPYFQFIRQN